MRPTLQPAKRQVNRRLLAVPPFRVLLIFASITSTLGQQPDSFAKKRIQLESAIAKYMSANSVPGLSVAIVQEGQLQWAAGFGKADLENSVPATSHTLYRLASVSKPITAVAAMQLWEHGKLDLDAPVQKYCARFPQKEWPITTRELLGHLGGVRSYRAGYDSNDPELQDVSRHFADPVQEGLQLFANDPLVAPPGTKFTYSTYGFTVVGCAIEGASAETYTDYARKNIFVGAGMSSTQSDDRYAVIPNRTRFYHKDNAGHIVNADYMDSSYKIPGGGWLSSAEDMAKFVIAILDDKLLTRKTRDIMWAPQKTSNGSPTSYGLGWYLNKDGDPFHEGGQQGTSTLLLIAPEHRSGVVVLINRDGLDPTEFAGELLKAAVSSP